MNNGFYLIGVQLNFLFILETFVLIIVKETIPFSYNYIEH